MKIIFKKITVSLQVFKVRKIWWNTQKMRIREKKENKFDTHRDDGFKRLIIGQDWAANKQPDWAANKKMETRSRKSCKSAW